MRRYLAVAAFIVTASSIAGCARGPANKERAQALASWLGRQSYSSYAMFRHRSQTPHEPLSPDGLTLGSPNVFAAIGCNPKDVMALDVFWADRRTAWPFSKPMTVSVIRDGTERAAADFGEQSLRRVRHTSIAVSEIEEDGLTVTSVDFAPMGSDESFLVRWFLVRNTGTADQQLRLRFKVGAPGDWKRGSRGAWVREGFAFVSDAKLAKSDETLDAVIGRVPAGQAGSAALLIVATKDAKALDQATARARTSLNDPERLLEATKSDWTKWCERASLDSEDQRTDDLMDSLLCLVRSHIGADAIHTGSLRYPHNRAWVRDSYWVQRTLLDLGYTDEAKLNLDFLHRAWKTSGIASWYEIPSGKSQAYGYTAVELPHYLTLMVHDAEMAGAVDGRSYWDMVKDCLDKAAVPDSGLQPMNGDETWLLASPVCDLDDLIDNSWLLIASAEYGAKLAERAGDPARAARYGSLAYRARLALTKYEPGTGDPPWYGIGRAGDGSLDFSLCPEIFARAIILDVLPQDDHYLRNGLMASWDRLQYDRGIRAHSRSATIDGGAPGYVLAAASQAGLPFTSDLAKRVLSFASATGNVWEFHDLYDPAWGGEKRRLWDSAVVLMGLAHTYFDVQPNGGHGRLFRRPAVEPEAAEAPRALFNSENAEALLANTGGALILQDQSPEHAARIARELIRQRNRAYAIGNYTGQPPDDHSAIIVSRSTPPDGWIAGPGYWLRGWSGPPQLWVLNRGDAFLDTDPLLFDLLSLLAPQREKPLPFPDASFDLVSRWGAQPRGEAEMTFVSAGEQKRDQLTLSGDHSTAKLAQAQVDVQVASGESNTLKLTVTAAGDRTAQSELAVIFPAGWWLVYARDMTGKWDRVNDPVTEVRLPDGRIRLVYDFRSGKDPVSLTFNLAQLRVVGQ